MRNYTDFIQATIDYAEGLKTPDIFKPFMGLSLISVALGRRVWNPSPLELPPAVPNIFVMLIAPPGGGKDMAINKVRDIIEHAQELAHPRQIAHIAAESISHKGIYDTLHDDAAKQIYTHKGKNIEFHSTTFILPELSTAIAEYDLHMIPLINHLYNNPPYAKDKIRGQEVSIIRPHITMLMGNQPDTLSNVFTEKNFKMGFTSRIIFVYHGHEIRRRTFTEISHIKSKTGMLENLAKDFLDMTNMAGPFRMTTPAAYLIDEFDLERPNPVPGGKFRDYNTRRPFLLQKLSMLCSASESNSMMIEPHHVERAIHFMQIAEETMPHIFDNIVGDRGFSDTFEQVYKLAEDKQYITHLAIVQELAKTRPPHEVRGIIETLITGGKLEERIQLNGLPYLPKQYKVCADPKSIELRSVK